MGQKSGKGVLGLQLKNVIPLLQWLPLYNREKFGRDLIAGLTVGVLLIPQSMAYAVVAGMPPVYGLYTAITPILIYPLFGSSLRLAIGPVAIASLLVVAGVSEVAVPGTEEYIRLAITLTAIAGVIRLLLGALRLGFVSNFLSRPVITGFTTAAAIIIIFSQLKAITAIALTQGQNIQYQVLELSQQIAELHPPTLILGSICLLVIILMKRFVPRIPAPLVMIILSVLIAQFFPWDQLGIAVVGEIPAKFPSFAIPQATWDEIMTLMPIAWVIALMSFMESYALAKQIETSADQPKVMANQELLAMGLTNVVGAFFQAYPISASFSRTAVNTRAGATTPISGLLSVILIIITLLFLTPYLYYLPKAVLAAIIMASVFGLIKVKEIKSLWQRDRNDWGMLMITLLSTLFLGIQYGVLVGVLVSVLIVLYRSSQPHYATMGRISGTDYYGNEKRYKNLIQKEHTLILRFEAQLYFVNVGAFRDMIQNGLRKKGKGVKYIILNAEGINDIDSSGLHMLMEMIDVCKSTGIQFYIASAKGHLRDYLQKAGAMNSIGAHQFFMQVTDAVKYIEYGAINEEHESSPFRLEQSEHSDANR